MDLALIERLRSDLAAARFTVDALGALWGGEADAALERANRLPAMRALAGDVSPLATFATLFVLGMPVSAEAAEAALPKLTLTGAHELGLVDVSGDVVVALVDLRPYDFLDAQGAGSWWIASDLGELATGRALRTDHVLGVGGASLTLSGLLIPDPVESVLDLGTGCGIQAMHASRWAGRVVATDISERAISFARLNAALNGISNIEFRLGSLFEPVVGERFDRIVSNPPFVITPRSAAVPEYEYRDGGMVGDALVEAVVTGARAHLVDGGIAQLLGNWEYRAAPRGVGTDGLQRAAGWADAAGLDVWIIERERQEPASTPRPGSVTAAPARVRTSSSGCARRGSTTSRHGASRGSGSGTCCFAAPRRRARRACDGSSASTLRLDAEPPGSAAISHRHWPPPTGRRGAPTTRCSRRG